MHDHRIQMRIARDIRDRQIAEAAEHRMARRRVDPVHGSFRRSVGRTIIRIGQAVAAERDAVLSPARPR